MTFAATGSYLQTNSTTSLSLSNQGIGDLIVLVIIQESTAYCSSLSGGGATWSVLGTHQLGSHHAWTAVAFAGTVTATGSQAVTLSWTGTPSAGNYVAGQEFTSTAGSWAIDGALGLMDNSGGTSTFPSLTPAGSGDLYFGYGWDSAAAIAGSTSGYTYVSDASGNGACWNPACTSGAQAPVWGDSHFTFGLAVLVRENAPSPAFADAAAAADQVSAQLAAIPPAVILAPPNPAGPPPPPIRAQILTVPQGNAVPQDQAGAAETMTAGTVTVPLADQAAAADSIAGGIYPADQAAAADALAITTVATTYTDPAAAADANLPQVQVALTENAAAADNSQTTGLTQADTAAAADQLTAAVTLAVTERAGATDGFGNEPAIGASGGATRPAAMPGTSQVSVAAPGSSRWYYLGSVGQVTALTYSYACPGGADAMSATLMVPASYRNQILYPGWQVRITRGGHQIWDGKLDEPVPTAQGWNLTAVGNGMRGSDFLAVYSDTWPSSQPDESINGAISRGLPWVNPGVGTPSGAWYGQGVDSGAQTITALLNLICTRGGLTWYVNSQPGGRPGDDLSVFPLPTVANRLLVATTPVPRTLGGDINTIYLRYEITADNPSSTTSSSAPATYGLAIAQNTQSVAQHGEMETYIDISDVGVMTQAAAQAVGNSVLQIYQRASFAGPFTGHYGDLLTMGGTPIDPGTDQAGNVCRLILTDFGWGGELVPGPVQFIVGGYSWDDFAQTFSATPYQNLDQSLTGLLQMENTVMTPITVASTG